MSLASRRVCLMMSHVHFMHMEGLKSTLGIIYQEPSILFFLKLFFLELSKLVSKLARYQALRHLPVSVSPGLRSQVCTATLGFPSEPSPHMALTIHFNIYEVLSGRGLFLVYLTRREYRKMPFQATLTV